MIGARVAQALSSSDIVAMQFAQRQVKDVTLITVSGQITMLDPPGQLRERVSSLIKSGERKIVLSLQNLSFVDSSCIGELVSCCLTVARAGGTLKLANPARRVQELLLITRLGPIFESYETDAEAVASFDS
ncbi:MAG: STAS domain-containing protein [Acidobacteriota bacterium]